MSVIRSIDEIRVGDEWLLNRPCRGPMTVHVLAIFKDKCGKNKVAIQLQYPKQKWIRPNYEQAKIVTPAYFYSLTVGLKKK